MSDNSEAIVLLDKAIADLKANLKFHNDKAQEFLRTAGQYADKANGIKDRIDALTYARNLL